MTHDTHNAKRPTIVLEVCNLSKDFGGLAAVKDVSFRVNGQEMVGLIGPNGAGKTTLFNLITGFERTNSGTVIFKGEDITRLKPHEIAKRGMVRTFQLTRCFPQLTVFENVAVAFFVSKAGKKGRSTVEQEMHDTLELVGLSGKASYLAKDLPHGDLKRLELARALATKPEMLLLDEPFCGLSVEEIAGVASSIQKLHREKGLTVIIIEHMLRELMKLVSNVIVLNYGEKIAEGSPKEISKNKKVIEAYLGEEIYA